jgi:hypothetical protein
MEAAAKKSRILIRNPVYGFKDPDPYQNVTDPENWLLLFNVCFCWLKRVFLTVLRIRNKSFGSGFGSGSGLKLVSDSDPDSNPDPAQNLDADPDPDPDPDPGGGGWGRSAKILCTPLPSTPSFIFGKWFLVTWIRIESDPYYFAGSGSAAKRCRFTKRTVHLFSFKLIFL